MNSRTFSTSSRTKKYPSRVTVTMLTAGKLTSRSENFSRAARKLTMCIVSPKISVCLDVFNYAEFLPRAIESVLEQTCGDFELIIADDCSTDSSYSVARSYRDSRIKLIRNEANLGMVRNRNVALRAARGDYVKPLHADDFLCARDALEECAALFDRHAALSLVASPMSFVNASGELTGAWSCFENDRLLTGTNVITRCLREQRNLIGGPSAVMFRRRHAERGFDETFFHM